MPTKRTLILIGLRGSGKSTVGRLLANQVGGSFVDLDEVTPGILGRGTVAQAWELDGQAAFRDAESEALRLTLEAPPAVLALGGGTPTAPGAAERINQARRSGAALVVYLRAAAGELRRRLHGPRPAGATGPGPDRPSLTGRDPLDEIEDVLAVRDPLYCSLADVVLESAAMPAAACVEAIVGVMKPGESPP